MVLNNQWDFVKEQKYRLTVITFSINISVSLSYTGFIKTAEHRPFDYLPLTQRPTYLFTHLFNIL